jgi:hypothetical protein
MGSKVLSVGIENPQVSSQQIPTSAAAGRHPPICLSPSKLVSFKAILNAILLYPHDKWVPVTTAWHVLRLRMEERPPDMEGSCDYFE